MQILWRPKIIPQPQERLPLPPRPKKRRQLNRPLLRVRGVPKNSSAHPDLVVAAPAKKSRNLAPETLVPQPSKTMRQLVARVKIDAVVSNADETIIAKIAAPMRKVVVDREGAILGMYSVMPLLSQSRSVTQSSSKLKALSSTPQPCTTNSKTSPTLANFSAYMSGFAKLMTDSELWISSSRLKVDNAKMLIVRTFRRGII